MNPSFRDEPNPYQPPGEIVRAELSDAPRKRVKRHNWHRSYSIGLIIALCLSLAMPDTVGKTEYVVMLGIVTVGLWVWTRF